MNQGWHGMSEEQQEYHCDWSGTWERGRVVEGEFREIKGRHWLLPDLRTLASSLRKIWATWRFCRGVTWPNFHLNFSINRFYLAAIFTIYWNWGIRGEAEGPNITKVVKDKTNVPVLIDCLSVPKSVWFLALDWTQTNIPRLLKLHYLFEILVSLPPLPPVLNIYSSGEAVGVIGVSPRFNHHSSIALYMDLSITKL